MLIVHHLNNSRSQRILWMLEELGLDYEIRRYRRNSDMSAPKDLKTIHLLGKSPILEDVSADGQRTVVVETEAICDYLVERADGRLGPSDATDTILYRQFMHYAECSVIEERRLQPVYGRPVRSGLRSGWEPTISRLCYP